MMPYSYPKIDCFCLRPQQAISNRGGMKTGLAPCAPTDPLKAEHMQLAFHSTPPSLRHSGLLGKL